MKKNLPIAAVIAVVAVVLIGLYFAYQSYSSDHVFTGTKTGRSKSDPPPLVPPSAPPMPSGVKPGGG